MKKEYIYEIEKLDSGFLLNDNNIKKIGLTNIENLEGKVLSLLENHLGLDGFALLRKNSKMKITFNVELE